MQLRDEKYDAEIIVGSPAKPLKGITHRHIIIYKSVNLAVAERWYFADEQQIIKRLRMAITAGYAARLPECAKPQTCGKTHEPH